MCKMLRILSVSIVLFMLACLFGGSKCMAAGAIQWYNPAYTSWQDVPSGGPLYVPLYTYPTRLKETQTVFLRLRNEDGSIHANGMDLGWSGNDISILGAAGSGSVEVAFLRASTTLSDVQVVSAAGLSASFVVEDVIPSCVYAWGNSSPLITNYGFIGAMSSQTSTTTLSGFFSAPVRHVGGSFVCYRLV